MTHGCTDCGFGYMDECEVYEDGTCKRDRAEAYTEREESNMTHGWQRGIPTKDGLYVIQIHPYGSMNRDPAYACYYIKNGVLKDCLDTEAIEPMSFWRDFAIKWKKINY